MFNECGEPNVNTVDIAAELDISPGNLYYHFRNKDEIITELFNRFEEHLKKSLEALEGSIVELIEIWVHLGLIFESIAAYRFIYRDINNLVSRHTQWYRQFRRITDQKEATTRFIIGAFEEEKKIIITPQGIDALVEQILLCATFSHNFHALRNAKTVNPNPASSDFQKKRSATESWSHFTFQIMMLISSYLPIERQTSFIETLVLLRDNPEQLPI